jgi:hypothetical protein
LTCRFGYNILLPKEHEIDLGNNIVIDLGISLRF